MSPEPVFLKSKILYESYTDFWSLVRLSGFTAMPAAEADFSSPRTFIWPTMDWETVERLALEPKGSRQARIIWWYLERPDAHRRGVEPQDLFRQSIEEVLQAWVDEVWVSERTLFSWDPRTRYVRLGGHPGLRESAPSVVPAFDVAHFGQLSPRRSKIIADLGRRGFTVTPGAWGSERAVLLEASSLLLNIDRVEGMHLAAPLRFVLAAAHRLPILTEAMADPDPLIPGESILQAPYEGLVDLVSESLLRKDLLGIGNAGYRALCMEHLFREEVLSALRA